MSALVRLHAVVFDRLQRGLSRWFPGLAARLILASVLLVYFLNSAMTKLGTGPLGLLYPSDGAYAQILPRITESAGYDTSQIAFLPYGLIVLLGMWAEFALPVLVVAGLFTRLASLGLIGFVIVMSYVDIVGHDVDAATIGGFFDRFPNALIADQRLLWIFPLVYLVIHGAGAISLDAVFMRRRHRRVPW